jgi:cobalamin biosynthesis Co2+ chelatase CbiK
MNKTELLKALSGPLTEEELFATLPSTITLSCETKGKYMGEISQKEFEEVIVPAWIKSGDFAQTLIAVALVPNNFTAIVIKQPLLKQAANKACELKGKQRLTLFTSAQLAMLPDVIAERITHE